MPKTVITSTLEFEGFVVINQDDVNLYNLPNTSSIFWTKKDAETDIEEKQETQDGNWMIYPVKVTVPCVPIGNSNNFALIEPPKEEIKMLQFKPRAIDARRARFRGDGHTLEQAMENIEKDWKKIKNKKKGVIEQAPELEDWLEVEDDEVVPAAPLRGMIQELAGEIRQLGVFDPREEANPLFPVEFPVEFARDPAMPPANNNNDF